MLWLCECLCVCVCFILRSACDFSYFRNLMHSQMKMTRRECMMIPSCCLRLSPPVLTLFYFFFVILIFAFANETKTITIPFISPLKKIWWAMGLLKEAFTGAATLNVAWSRCHTVRECKHKTDFQITFRIICEDLKLFSKAEILWRFMYVLTATNAIKCGMKKNRIYITKKNTRHET